MGKMSCSDVMKLWMWGCGVRWSRWSKRGDFGWSAVFQFWVELLDLEFGSSSSIIYWLVGDDHGLAEGCKVDRRHSDRWCIYTSIIVYQSWIREEEGMYSKRASGKLCSDSSFRSGRVSCRHQIFYKLKQILSLKMYEWISRDDSK